MSKVFVQNYLTYWYEMYTAYCLFALNIFFYIHFLYLIWHVIERHSTTLYLLSFWGQLFFMLVLEIKASKPPRNGLKSGQRHKIDPPI